jgi:hypothetical protein
MADRSRRASFVAAGQVRFERPEEGVDALDMVRVVALQPHD